MSNLWMRIMCLMTRVHLEEVGLRCARARRLSPRRARVGAGPVRRRPQMQMHQYSIQIKRHSRYLFIPSLHHFPPLRTPTPSHSHSRPLTHICNQTCIDRPPRGPPGHIGPIRLVHQDSRLTMTRWDALYRYC